MEAFDEAFEALMDILLEAGNDAPNVLVNGRFTLRDGRFTSEHGAGCVLRRAR